MFYASDRQRRVGLALLRVVVGIVFFMHGWLKLQMGHAGVTDFFGQFGVPAPGLTAWVLILLEIVGGIAFVIGFLTRLVALGFAIDVGGALLLVHLENGFFADKGGIELVLTLLAASLAFVIAGPGAASVDEWIAHRRRTG